MILRHLFIALLIVCGFLAHPQTARAAQSYDNCAGFIDALPATITTQGTWCLRHDLSTNIATGNAVTIAENDVTIDCNDFKLGGLAAGNTSQAKGIYAGNLQNATIRQCNIRGFYVGIDLSGAGHLVEGNRLDGNLAAGIRVSGNKNGVRDNAIYETGGFANGTQSKGIETDSGYAMTDIAGNIVDGVFTDADTVAIYGIDTHGASRIVGNRINGLRLKTGGESFGITAGAPYRDGSLVEGNRIMSTSNDGEFGIYGVTDYSHILRPNVACRNNTVAGFGTDMSDCSDDGGNGQH